MTALKTFDASLLSLLILILIYLNSFGHLEYVFTDFKLYIQLVQTNIILLVLDLSGWAVNGLPGYAPFLGNLMFNLMLYMFAPVAAILWILYVNFQVYHDEDRIKKINYLLLVIFLINAALSVISLHTGWYFNVDEYNQYHRGDYYWVHVAICFGLLIFSAIFILFNGKLIKRTHFYSMLLFVWLPMVGAAIQALYYGYSLAWIGMMLSLLIIYWNIQLHGMNTDYLTGIFNRRQLDNYIKDKIRNSTEAKSFSAILIDVNEFKHINDKFGHDVGDDALKISADIVRKSVRRDDFVARYGGDEFFVILDINNRELLERAVARIRSNVEKFNLEGQKPYKLSFSIGYDLYDWKSSMKSSDFMKHVDTIMYTDKKARSA